MPRVNRPARTFPVLLTIALAVACWTARLEAQTYFDCPGGPTCVNTGNYCQGVFTRWPAGFCGCQGGHFFWTNCWDGMAGTAPDCCTVECGYWFDYTAPCGVPPPEIPDEPPCPRFGGPTPPGSVGRPVSLTTGAAFFTHTDAVVGDLVFSRSWSSSRLSWTNRYGVFYRGWNFSFEGRINRPATNRIEVRLADGGAQHYFDENGDGLFQSLLPYSEDSWVETTPGGYRRSFRSGGEEIYDLGGKLLSVTDRSGTVTTYSYDAQGRFSSVSRSGRSLSIAYVGTSTRPAQLLGPTGEVLATYTYDPNTSLALASVTYPDGSGYQYTYDPWTLQIVKVTDLGGKMIEAHAYDISGRAATSEIGDGVERLTFSYASNQPTVTVTDARGNATTYQYVNVRGTRRVTSVTGPCSACGGGGGDTQSWTYDDKERITAYTNGAGKTTRYEYDPITGDLLREIDPLNQVTSYTYDAQGRVLSKTAPDGAVITYAYAPAGPTSITESVTTTTTRTTSISYTPEGKVQTITDPRGKVTTFAYSVEGDLASVTAPPVGGVSSVTTFTYDAMGRRTSVTDPLGNKTTTEYDARGRVTKISDPALKATTFAYDKGGRRTSVTDALNRITSYGYDLYGRLETVTDPLTGVTRYGYDLMSNLISLTDARGKITTFEYDAHNRVTKVIWPGGIAFESFTYDLAGRLATRTDRRGVVTTYTYDALGRLTGKSYSDGTAPVSYTYDAVGRLLTASNVTDALTWTYDLAGQVLSAASAKNASLIEYAYDASGNRLSVSLNGQVHLTYAYDDASRLTSLTRGTKAFAFSYDAASRRTGLTNPNGTATTYAYDVVSRLTSVATKRSKTSLTSSTYTYDAVGNRLTKGGDFAETYTYDALYRLSQAKRGTKVSESYTYDAVGNRLSALNSSPWTYDDRNQLLSLPGTSFTYDANGNQATKSEGTGTTSFEYEAENRLLRVVKGATELERYAYDPLGRRAERVSGGLTTGFTYDGEDILRESRSDGATFKYVHGPGIDEPLAKEDGAGALSHLHADGLGSIVKSTSASGSATGTLKYNSFGVLESGTPAPYAFTGREWDAGGSLYYYRARYYDPKIGRFLSEDPIGFFGGINFFTYVENNPVNWTDPFGLKAAGAVTAFVDPFKDIGQCVASGVRQPHITPVVPATATTTLLLVLSATTANRGADFGPNELVVPNCKTCPKKDRSPCDRLLELCLENPFQPPHRRKQWGPRKDCGACYRECVNNDGAWPFYKCPIF